MDAAAPLPKPNDRMTRMRLKASRMVKTRFETEESGELDVRQSKIRDRVTQLKRCLAGNKGKCSGCDVSPCVLRDEKYRPRGG